MWFQCLVVVEPQHVVDELAVVLQAWHFALSAELAGRCEPSVEEPLVCNGDGEWGEEYVACAFCLIVGVLLGEPSVECGGECVDVGGRAVTFYQPLVVSA